MRLRTFSVLFALLIFSAGCIPGHTGHKSAIEKAGQNELDKYNISIFIHGERESRYVYSLFPHLITAIYFEQFKAWNAVGLIDVKKKTLVWENEYRDRTWTMETFSERSDQILSSHNVISLKNGRELRRFSKEERPSFESRNINPAAYSSDGKFFAWESDGNLLFWDASSFKVIKRMNLEELKIGNMFRVLSIPQQNELVIIGFYGNAKIIDMLDFKLLKSLSLTKPTGPMRFSQDGKYLVSFGWQEDTIVYNFPALTVNCKLSKGASDAQFSPDGKYVGTVYQVGKRLDVWDISTGKNIASIEAKDNETYSGISFTKDGKYFASGRHESNWNNTIVVWGLDQRIVFEYKLSKKLYYYWKPYIIDN